MKPISFSLALKYLVFSASWRIRLMPSIKKKGSTRCTWVKHQLTAVFPCSSTVPCMEGHHLSVVANVVCGGFHSAISSWVLLLHLDHSSLHHKLAHDYNSAVLADGSVLSAWRHGIYTCTLPKWGFTNWIQWISHRMSDCGLPLKHSHDWNWTQIIFERHMPWLKLNKKNEHKNIKKAKIIAYRI